MSSIPPWYSFSNVIDVAKSFLRKSVPAVITGGMTKQESSFLDLRKTGVDDRASTLFEGVHLLSCGDAHDELKMKAAAIELLHVPTLGEKDPPPSTHSAKHEDVVKDLLEVHGERMVHPQNVSALVDGYFSLLSLCLNPPDNAGPSQNLTGPYLDLTPLYGHANDATDRIRTKDGRGALKPDCFLEERVRLLPPIVSALLVLWNRNHNFIAHNLFIRFAVNKGWKTDFSSVSEPEKAKQDDEIFNIVRRVNCIQFRNTIAEDILRGLFGLSELDPSPKLDLLADVPNRPKAGKMRSYKGTSFLYTLNPMISHQDAARVDDILNEITNDEGISQHSLSSFRLLYSEFVQGTQQEPTSRDYPGLQRDARTGRFLDKDLASILLSARDELACAPAALNSPPCNRINHLKALDDEANWKICTFNEFRKLYGLKPLPSFTAWNSDTQIADAAERLYGHIDQLGLYVGLQCEASSPRAFGFGFTKTYALLVDLVTRIRSDPGLEEPIYSGEVGDPLSRWIHGETVVGLGQHRTGNGAVLPKLLQRNLPQFYPYNNAYSYFLFSTSDSVNSDTDNRTSIEKTGLIFERVSPRHIHTISDISAVQQVFRKPEVYHTLYAESFAKVTNDYGYLLGFDGSLKDMHAKDRLMTMYALIPDDGSLQRYGALFGKLTASVIKQRRGMRNKATGMSRIDIIGDVINEVCTRWVCETLCDYDLLEEGTAARPKDKEKRKTAKEMHQQFANLYTFIFKTFDRDDGYEAERRAIESSKFLREHIEQKIPKPVWLQSKSLANSAKQNVQDLAAFAYQIVIAYFGGIRLNAYTAQTFLDRAVQASRIIPLPKADLEKRIKDGIASRAQATKMTKPTQKDHDEVERNIEVSRIVANILGLSAVTAVNLPQACSIVVDFYLQEKYSEERAEIVKLSKMVPKTEQERIEVNEKLAPYIHEALRISQPLTLWRCAVEDDTITTSKKPLSVRKGDIVFADFQKLHNSGDDSHKVSPGRRTESLLGMGVHKCPALTKDPSKSFIDSTMPEIIKAIFNLDELSRVPGDPHSVLNSVQVHPNASRMDPRAFIDKDGGLAYYPQTMILQFRDSSSGEISIDDKKHKWDAGFAPNTARKITKATEKFLAIATSVWIAYKATLTLLAFWSLILILLGYGARLRHVAIPQATDVQQVFVECPEPLIAWEDWGPKTLEVGPDGIPLTVYTSTLSMPHRLNLFDADKKDMRLALYVDDILRGISLPDIEVNKEEDCGVEPYNCYTKGFSGADIVVPAGAHSVRIQWAGKEFLNGTTVPDLGEDASRRIVWARYYCGSKP